MLLSLPPYVTIPHLNFLISFGYINQSICNYTIISSSVYFTNFQQEVILLEFSFTNSLLKCTYRHHPPSKMAILIPRITQAKQILRRSLSNGSSTVKSMDVPKGYLAVYVGELEKKRFVVPVWLLRQPTFQELLDQAEEEFGYIHPMGGLTIPCSEYTFTDLASRLGAL